MSIENENTTDPNGVPVETADTEDNLDDFSNDFFSEDKEEVADAPAKDTQENDEEDNALAPEDADDEETSEEAEDSEEDAVDEQGESDEGKAPKKKNRFQERIDELNGKFRQEEREKNALAERLTVLEARLAQNEQATKPAEKEPAKTVEAPATGPKPNDVGENGEAKYPLGEYDPKYITDLAEHRFELRLQEMEKSRQQEDQQRKAEAEFAATQQAWNAKVAPAQERYPDYVEKTQALSDRIGDNLDPQYSAYLADSVMQMDNGPDVLYYLSNNPDEAMEIINSGALKATMKLGAISERLTSSFNTQKEQKKPKVSNAPEPPTSLNKGSSTVKSAVRPDTDDLKDFEKSFFVKD